jgi:hypothetical protein
VYRYILVLGNGNEATDQTASGDPRLGLETSPSDDALPGMSMFHPSLSKAKTSLNNDVDPPSCVKDIVVIWPRDRLDAAVLGCILTRNETLFTVPVTPEGVISGKPATWGEVLTTPLVVLASQNPNNSVGGGFGHNYANSLQDIAAFSHGRVHAIDRQNLVR